MRAGDAGRRTRIANSKGSVVSWLGWKNPGMPLYIWKRLPMAESVICIRSDRGEWEDFQKASCLSKSLWRAA